LDLILKIIIRLNYFKAKNGKRKYLFFIIKNPKDLSFLGIINESLENPFRNPKDSMSSESSTPTSERSFKFDDSNKVYYAPPACPIKRMKVYLNKITDRTFDKISGEMLQVVILEDPLSEESKESDKEKMLPIVQTFISTVCVFERNEEAMNVYVKSFCKLRTQWKGRQGRVLTELMMSELMKFFVEYSKVPESENTEENTKRRNSCFKLCRFVSLLYQEGVLSLKAIVTILQSFCKNDKLSLEVFCKIFSGCQEKLMTDEFFMAKIFGRYKSFLEGIVSSEDHESMHKFMCMNILDKT
jgi:hypothetical protein